MSAKTVVRLVDAPDFPLHGAKGLEPAKGALWSRWRGKPIVIHLPPEPNVDFEGCDSPIVWRVAEESAGLIVRPGRGTLRPCVCPHQVEID